jgi:predicted NBD/HSP70 family sugar kinase
VLVPVARAGSVVGIDIGHAHVAVVIGSTAGRVLAERWAAVDADHDPHTVFDTAQRLAAGCAEDAGIAPGDLLAAAAGVPGPVAATDGAIRSRTILPGWVGELPARELGRRLGLPVVVGNDADMGARGELRFGAARGLRDVVYVKASHGIGAGLVLGGRSYRGSLGLAGEIGHLRVAGATGRCRCGNRGCLETVASVDAVRDRLGAADGAAGTALSDLVAGAEGRRVVAEAGRTLGRVLADLCTSLNPQAVLIGGELGALGAPVLAGAREAIDRYAQPAAARAVTVRRAQLGLRAELLGAAWTAVQQVRRLG